MNKFITAIDGWKQSKVYYQDTDSLYIHQKDIQLLKDAGCYHDANPFCGKNDLACVEQGIDGTMVEVNPKIVEAVFLGPKQKIV